MLKINLLPSQRRDVGATAADNQRTFAILMAIAVALTGVGIFMFHSSKSDEIEQIRRRNNGVDGQVRQLRARVADHPRVQRELAEIAAREDAITHLQQGRTGPMAMLVELSHILSPGGRPTTEPGELERIQRENPTMMFDRDWDTHRVWLRRFVESDRAVTMEGDGRTPADVSQFMRRMMVSRYFSDVRLERSEGGVDQPTGITVQHFRIAARVRY